MAVRGQEQWPVPMRAIGAQNLLTMPGGITQSGYLHKKGASQWKIMKWPLRYVIIHKGCIYYFKSSTAAIPQGAFSLNGYNRVMRSTEETTSNNVFPFKIIHVNKKHRTWYFSAACEEERKKWMKCLREEIDRYHEKVESLGNLSDNSDTENFYGAVERPVQIKYNSLESEAGDYAEDDEEDEDDYMKPDAPQDSPEPEDCQPALKLHPVSSEMSGVKSPPPPLPPSPRLHSHGLAAGTEGSPEALPLPSHENNASQRRVPPAISAGCPTPPPIHSKPTLSELEHRKKTVEVPNACVKSRSNFSLDLNKQLQHVMGNRELLRVSTPQSPSHRGPTTGPPPVPLHKGSIGGSPLMPPHKGSSGGPPVPSHKGSSSGPPSLYRKGSSGGPPPLPSIKRSSSESFAALSHKGSFGGPPPLTSISKYSGGPPPVPSIKGSNSGPPPVPSTKGSSGGPPPVPSIKGSSGGPPLVPSIKGSSGGPPPVPSIKGSSGGPPPVPSIKGSSGGPPPVLSNKGSSHSVPMNKSTLSQIPTQAEMIKHKLYKPDLLPKAATNVPKPPPVSAKPKAVKHNTLPLQRSSPDGQSFRSVLPEKPLPRSRSQSQPLELIHPSDEEDDDDNDYESVQLPDSVFLNTTESNDVERLFISSSPGNKPANGLYCIRNSSKSGQVLVVWDDSEKKVRNYRIFEKESKFYLESEIKFMCLPSMVEFYYNHTLPIHEKLYLKAPYGPRNPP
ncbi:SH3 domain-binding protein 2 isoform X1 [Amblyraja radiata]|uniref:SH3 domain-binding protein 2 isoform X1 n=1 Tax=Amblyraja radiata TaxID=386614 RepID=UPI001403C187|nr:SH3 domain-binding protein 2 isoform X1 [Amblyraja radiata]